MQLASQQKPLLLQKRNRGHRGNDGAFRLQVSLRDSRYLYAYSESYTYETLLMPRVLFEAAAGQSLACNSQSLLVNAEAPHELQI